MVTFALRFFVLASCIYSCIAAAIPSTIDISSLADLDGGDPVCEGARRQVIASLRASSRDVVRVGSTAGNNAVVRNAVSNAQTGMRDATSGITQVAFALLAGDEPTKASRDLIAKGFSAVKTALEALSKVSPIIKARVARARTSLNQAVAAGNRLVVDCGGSDPIDLPESGVGKTITLTPAALRAGATATGASTAISDAPSPTTTAMETDGKAEATPVVASASPGVAAETGVESVSDASPTTR